ncbi:dehydrodolichyl diphosphate syntase complex subunit nus1 [Biomphalaria glabrata]|nr:dehydrodolichyl diphosphate syntase complex subunit nus1-like [Biomphalaria glabrata]KAI8791911.1 dehydrodolichyl diphosphate syntase complex subunit nus1 [Biomphalaria glabrata]
MPMQTISFSKKSVTYKIQSDSKSLKKLPTHVGFVVVEDEFSFRDLANLIVWSVSLGISYITIYDINGEIKRNSLVLQRNIESSREEIMSQEKTNYDIQIVSSSHPVSCQSSSGSCKAQKVKVHLLCVEDSHSKIISVAQHLCHLVSTGAYQVDDITPSNVDTFLQESLQFPDPDLCIKFGSVDCLFGYLPWQIRLTEFISLPSHKGVTYKSFLSTLVQFGNTNQRFGK